MSTAAQTQPTATLTTAAQRGTRLGYALQAEWTKLRTVSGPAWLLRLTPTAGLAIQQSIPRYPQVTSVLSPVRGYYPLSPYAGFAVLCLWAAAALGLAFVLLRRRDA
jgi:hypothetical protein